MSMIERFKWKETANIGDLPSVQSILKFSILGL